MELLALNLPESQRAKLAADLLDSLPGVLVDDDAGLAEALRRRDGKTTSSREQIIVNVVGCVIPDPHERTLPLVQPSPPLHIVLPGFQ
jgi:hypothetical protein